MAMHDDPSATGAFGSLGYTVRDIGWSRLPRHMPSNISAGAFGRCDTLPAANESGGAEVTAGYERRTVCSAWNSPA